MTNDAMLPTPVCAPKPSPITHTSGLAPEVADLALALAEFPEDSPQYLLGAMLGYWGRERFADTLAKFNSLKASKPKMLKNPDVLCGLKFQDLEEGRGRGAPRAVFSFPPQRLGKDLKIASAVFMANGPRRSQASLYEIDPENHTVTVRWTTQRFADGYYPERLVADTWVNPMPKPSVLADLASAVYNGEVVNQVTWDILTAQAPRFAPNTGPKDGIFTDDVQEATEWINDLDYSYVAVQGPPGTGKTYLGAHLIHAAVLAGKRVGITAMSHSAVENLLEGVVTLFNECGDSSELFAVKKVSKEPRHPVPGVSYEVSNQGAASPRYNVVAGTTWLFASDAMLDAKVDILFIDEAGQLSLADAVVASLSARNVVLLGDPLQLAQVAQATHPGHAGDSVLTYVLDGEKMVLPDRGVFLSTTRRMHPEITKYISERFYEGRLGVHDSCAVQDIEKVGTGLRFLIADHADCTTEAGAEVELVRKKILSLLNKAWTAADGSVRPLEAGDFMVVTPFNDQVDLLRTAFDEDPRLESVQVGTVDKFQGREAPVVFFTMTTSSRDDMVRGVEFLFSPNRLNVAVSRARGLVYLVATPELVKAPEKPHDIIDHVVDFVARTASGKAPKLASALRPTKPSKAPAPKKKAVTTK